MSLRDRDRTGAAPRGFDATHVVPPSLDPDGAPFESVDAEVIGALRALADTDAASTRGWAERVRALVREDSRPMDETGDAGPTGGRN